VSSLLSSSVFLSSSSFLFLVVAVVATAAVAGFVVLVCNRGDVCLRMQSLARRRAWSTARRGDECSRRVGCPHGERACLPQQVHCVACWALVALTVLSAGCWLAGSWGWLRPCVAHHREPLRQGGRDERGPRRGARRVRPRHRVGLSCKGSSTHTRTATSTHGS
jgi:hypothetical protein